MKSQSPALTRSAASANSNQDKNLAIAPSPAKQKQQHQQQQHKKQQKCQARPHSADSVPVAMTTENQIAAALEKLLSNEAFVDKIAARLEERLCERLSAEVSAKVLAELDGRLEAMADETRRLASEVDTLKSNIARLEEDFDSRLDELAQYSRRNNIRVSGIPEVQGENVTATVVSLLNEKLNVGICPDDIDRCHRVGRPTHLHPPAADDSSSTRVVHRQILIKFVSYQKRNLVITGRRNLKGTGFSIHEDLTMKRRTFFKDLCIKIGFKNVWSRDGVVFWKKNGKTVSQFSKARIRMNENCGLANKMTRIVGGWATEINAYPWMVGLAVKGRLFCGGTLISDLHVITAAHCVLNIAPDRLYILISEHNVATRDELTTEVRRVAKVTIHPQFGNTVKYNNDIAIIKLDARVMFRSAAQPACLPPKDLELEGSTGKVIGWGAVKEGGHAATELMETDVTVFSDEECKATPQFPVKGITSNMFCAGHKGGGHDSCQGDSGGPILVTDSRGRYTIAGIVSWGVGCARPNKPGIYTKVGNYIDWISNVTSDGCFCF